MVIGIIIQGRLASTRLKDKILLPFYKDKSLIEILIQRLKKNKYKLPVILATTDSKYDDKLVKAVRDSVEVFRGNEFDVMDRFIKTMEKYNLTHAIRVCSDNPFLSLEYIDKLVTESQTKCLDMDYVGYSIGFGLPSIRSHIGYFAEFVSYDALKTAYSLTEEKFDREHVTFYIHSNPEKFNIHLINFNYNGVLCLTNIRLTLDTQEDFDMLSEMYTKLINDNKELNLHNIYKLIESTPKYQQTMLKMIQKYTK